MSIYKNGKNFNFRKFNSGNRLLNRKILFIFFCFIVFVSANAGNLPNILLITTGGTIAGKGSSAVSEKYTPGEMTGKELEASVPGLSEIANLTVLKPFNIGSNNMLPENWVNLSNIIETETGKGKYDGIVITHGTDTLEETAYYLNLVLKTKVPVVVTGAMRPSTAISADGPANLYQAILVASSNEAKDKGVLVVFNGKVFSAREVTKINTINTDAFASPNTGPLAIVNTQSLYWNCINIKKHTIDTPFEIHNLEDFSKVFIIYEYAGTSSAELLKAAVGNNPDGIVLAGFGDGSVPGYFDSLIEEATGKGIVIVRSSRTGSGPVLYNSSHNLDEKFGVVSANDLNPQKARILLALSLKKTKDPKTIRKYFDTY